MKKLLLLFVALIALQFSAKADSTVFDFTQENETYGLTRYDSGTTYINNATPITNGIATITLSHTNTGDVSWRLWTDGLRATKNVVGVMDIYVPDATISQVKVTATKACTVKVDANTNGISVSANTETTIDCPGETPKLTFTQTSTTAVTKIEIIYTLPDTGKEKPGIAWTQESYECDWVTPTVGLPEFDNPHGLTCEFTSSDEAVATIDANGNVTLVGVGTTELTAKFDGDDTYDPATVSCSFTVVNSQIQDAGIAWDAEEYTCDKANPTENLPVFSNPNNLPVTFASSSEAVATIDENGAITLLASGSTTLTATFAGNNTYKSAIAECKLKVSNSESMTYTIDLESSKITSNTYNPYQFTDNGIIYELTGNKGNTNDTFITWNKGNSNNGKQSGIVIKSNPSHYEIESITVDWTPAASGAKIAIYKGDDLYVSCKETIHADQLSKKGGVQLVEDAPNGTGNSILNYTFNGAVNYVAITPTNTKKAYINSITFTWSKPRTTTHGFITRYEARNNSEHKTNEIGKGAEDGTWAANHLDIDDQKDYEVDFDVETAKMTYSRTISESDAANWHAIYLPFGIADWSNYFSYVSEFTGVRSSSADDVTLRYTSLAASEPMKAHTVYLVKLAAGKTMLDIEELNTKLEAKPDADGCNEYATGGRLYRLTGTYVTKTDMAGKYALAGGVFRKGSDKAVLKPYRAYMEVLDETSGAQALTLPQSMTIEINPTPSAIDTIINDADEVEDADAPAYDLQGRRVENPANGIFVKGGKKVLVK